jgi:RimJ/RimL family protein N-acetyltransferase
MLESSIFSYDSSNKLHVAGLGSKYALRPATGGDIGFYQDLFANPQAMKYFGDGRLYGHEQTSTKLHTWLQRFEAGHPHGAMTVFDSDETKLGYIIAGPSGMLGVAEIAYAYMPYSWGRGVGSAAVKTIVEAWAPEVRRIGLSNEAPAELFKCFSGEALLRLYATASPANRGSWTILDKNGFAASKYKLNTEVARLDYDGRSFSTLEEMDAEISKKFDPLYEPKPLPSGVLIAIIDPDGKERTLSMHEFYGKLRYHFAREVYYPDEPATGQRSR